MCAKKKGNRSSAAGRKPGEEALLEFFARCAGGFEDVLGRELRTLRMRRVRPQVGGVIFFGTLADGYRACLWSRVATRIQLVVARVADEDADELYQGVYNLPWESQVVRGATIAVDAHGENPNLRNTKFVALKVKDALCDRLRDRWGVRPDVDAAHPDLAVNVAVHPKKATIYLNLSGASLHRRGYRAEGVQTEAPLKETLAAGILLAAGWDELAEQGAMLADPMCGSATLAIEAALIAAHVAPGLLRTQWGFEGWQGHDPQLWEQVRTKAEESRLYAGGAPRIIAGDLDAQAVEIARANVARAGVDDLVRLHVGDAADMGRHLRGARRQGGLPGLMVANPPYGARLLSQRALPQVYAALSAAVEAAPAGWKLALITPDQGIDTALGRMPEQTIACYNGPIQTWVRIYDTATPRLLQDVASLGGIQHKVPIAEPNSAQFAARLRKVARERLRWARREGIGCLRVYDADLPDYALSIDLYEGAAQDEGKRAVVIEEHRRPASVDRARAARRLSDAAALAAALFDVDAQDVVVRPWQGGASSTNRGEGRPEEMPLTVIEAGLVFALDINGRPDSGLPLHLRGLRALAAEKAPGARVANLFATTGAATVRAAAAGAAQTVSIDPFEDRVDAIRQALRRNGFGGKTHQFVCADARNWLAQEARRHHTYDVVLCVPPAWMKAVGATAADWELQRDHVSLLVAACQVLSRNGVCLFGCLDRSFALDEKGLRAAGLVVEDVSAQTLPRDLERSARDWHGYLLRRR